MTSISPHISQTFLAKDYKVAKKPAVHDVDAASDSSTEDFPLGFIDDDDALELGNAAVPDEMAMDGVEQTAAKSLPRAKTLAAESNAGGPLLAGTKGAPKFTKANQGKNAVAADKSGEKPREQPREKRVPTIKNVRDVNAVSPEKLGAREDATLTNILDELLPLLSASSDAMARTIRKHVKKDTSVTENELFENYIYYTRGTIKYLYEAMRREAHFASAEEELSRKLEIILPHEEGDFWWETGVWGPPFPHPALPLPGASSSTSP
ncbi:hypothetical protein BDN72DRAFT_864797 [Pluteus cervinus]|uniref:Uncharacterized protein n=1 Tax=Pluteus cervinus TaxID=181527 RepID=A0ACD3A2K2_9AGAR|nr:hypothetical protein BDN72DRAFT_864797 [Pluteus cervinus]